MFDIPQAKDIQSMFLPVSSVPYSTFIAFFCLKYFGQVPHSSRYPMIPSQSSPIHLTGQSASFVTVSTPYYDVVSGPALAATV